MKFYNAHVWPLPDIHVGSSVAVQNPQTKLWDVYGIVTEIGPHRRYYIKTHSGHVLVRNHRFLRRRVPPPPAPSLAIIPPMKKPKQPPLPPRAYPQDVLHVHATHPKD